MINDIFEFKFPQFIDLTVIFERQTIKFRKNKF